MALVRTVGISAHIDAGKTTTTERMLLHSGAISRCGSVDAGSTTTDFLPEERERGITIKAAAVTFGWRGHTVNLIDTPGHVDFTVEVERSFRVLDGSVALYDAVSGVEAQSETVWAQASRYGVARVGFVNKMDREGACYVSTAAAIAKRLRCCPLLLHLPVGSSGSYVGSVDLLRLQLTATAPAPAPAAGGAGAGSSEEASEGKLLWQRMLPELLLQAGGAGGAEAAQLCIPGKADGSGALTVGLAQLCEAARAAREALLLALCDADDAVAEAYLSACDAEAACGAAGRCSPGSASWDTSLPGLSAAELTAAVRRLVCAHSSATTYLPLLCGSSGKNKGVPALLDAVVDFLPSPLDKPALPATLLQRAAAGGGGGGGGGKGARKGKGAARKAAASAAASAAPAEAAEAAAEVLVAPSPSGPLRALAFKVQNHPIRGPLVFFRVYSGCMTRALQLHNTSRDELERASKLLQLFGDELREVEAVGAGHIGAASGLKSVRTGDTLCHAGDPAPVLLPRLSLPAPVFTAALEVGSSSEAKALEAALALLCREDPSLAFSTQAETGQLLLSGMGELHLDVSASRLQSEYGIAGLSLGRVAVAYREAPALPAASAATHDRLVNGRRAAATVELLLSPCEQLLAAGQSHFAGNSEAEEEESESEGEGEEGEEGQLLCLLSAEDGSPAALRPMPPLLAAAVSEGISAAFSRGPLLGSPVVGLRVQLRAAGTALGPDSSPAAVRAAVARAMEQGLREAACELLEPIMLVSVSVPEGPAVGSVMQDLSTTRRGRIREVMAAGGAGGGEEGGGPGGASQQQQLGTARSIVCAQVPLAEMVGYSTAIRSRTAGEGSFSMHFDSFAPVGAQLQRKIVAEGGF
jgi:elongation factor G